jgi:hypothetical protein
MEATATRKAEILPTTLRQIPYGNVASVLANAVNTGIIRVGNNVHAIMFYAQAAAVTPLTRAQLIVDIATIRLFLNGELVYDRTATECLDEYLWSWSKFGALAAPLGCLVCPFVPGNLPIFDQNRGFALGMLKSNGVPGQGPYNTLSYELTMTAAPATATQIEIHAVCDNYPQEATGLHLRRLRTTRDILGVGENHITSLPTNMYGINAYHVITAAGNIAEVGVAKDEDHIRRNMDVSVMNVMSDQAGYTPVAGWTSIPFNLTNDLQGCEQLRGRVVNWDVNLVCAIAPGAGTVILSEEVHDSIRE